MISNRHGIFATSLVVALGAGAAAAQGESPTATAELFDQDGQPIGTVELQEMKRGTLLHGRLEGLPPGTHAFHVHETGTCEPPFDSAGGHHNPAGLEHGYLAAAGHHSGDLPNIHISGSGELEFEMFNGFMLLGEQLFDEDGAAIVVHEGADDYASQPAGAAGGRIACGVIEQA